MKKYKDLLLRLIPLLVVVALTIGLSEMFYQVRIRATTERCWEELSMAHNEAAREIGNRLNNNIKMLQLASDAIMMVTDLQDEKAVQNYLASVLEETIFDRIDVVYPDGTVLLQATGERIVDQGEKTYSELLSKGVHLSPRTTDFLTGQQVVRALSPIYNSNGEPIAILAASAYCKTLANIFVSAHYGDAAQLFLVDMRDGSIVLDKWHEVAGSVYDMSGYQLSGEYEGTDLIADIMAGRSGKMEYTSQMYGTNSYTIYAPVPNTSFSLIMVVQEDVLLADVHELKDSLMWVGFAEIVVLMLFTVWIYFITQKSTKNANRAQEAELALLLQKEKELERQYAAASERSEFMTTLAINLPGGYHRVTTDHSFRISFISNSFTQITGYTMEQVENELDGQYIGIVAPADRAFFMSMAPQLERDGYIHCAYRMRRRDGSIRWVQDSTQYVERDGEKYYQCTLTDIHDIILKQEKLTRQASMLDTLEHSMPGGYHRCADADGWPFLLISRSFAEVTGWTREEIETEFDNLFINMVLPEDVPLCAGIIDDLQHRGYSNAMYRLKKKGGGYTWVSDSTMRVELENERFFHGVLADVTKQVEEMEHAKQEAEASSRAKSTFLFNISHDIRTPMNAIKGFSHIIAENADDPKLVRETVDKIHQASDSLMMLMNDVLDISRIERGKDEVNLQPIDLRKHGENLHDMFAADMEAAGIRFVMEADHFNDRVYCDELKITRILMNMLSNAKKFTPAGGTVTCGCKRLNTDGQFCTYRIFVRDTGIGMSSEFQKRAFEQFERERTSTESGVAGSGLGLAIIKMLVELMGGTIELHSELGKGTEIAVILTLRLAEQEQAPQPSQAATTMDMTGKHVLLVEDNDFNREIARYVLEGMGLVVDEASNGAICIEKLMDAQPGTYDLILMDIQMPVMDGYTATTEIRNLADAQKAAIPIVAMTANAFEEDKQRCLDAGMNGHIGKPIDMNMLIKELSRVFR